ncbi:MAG TPA: hypothetical protein VGG03_07720 [Thermoanaerobaculia bacterium]|jgi:hypothetical protein
MKGSRLTASFLGLMVLLAAPFLLELAAPDADPLPARAVLVIGGFGKLLFLAAAAFLAWRNTSSFEGGTPARAGWLRLSLGLALFALAQAGLVLQQLSQNRAVFFPSPSDVFFLLAYPLFIAALLAFLRAYTESGHPIGDAAERRRTGLVAAAACVALAVPLLRPVMLSDAPAAEKALNAAYTLFDFALLVPTVILLRIALRFPGGAVGRIWTALLSGFLFLCVGDILFAYLTAMGAARLDPLVDIAYLAAYGSLALGTAYQREVLR